MTATNGAVEKLKAKQSSAALSQFAKSELKNAVKLKSAYNKKKPKPDQGNWKERAKELQTQDEEYLQSLEDKGGRGRGSNSPSPVVTQLNEKDLSTFSTGRPLHDELDHVVCKHCKRPVIKAVAVSHIKACLRMKTEKAKERKKAKEAAAAAALAASKGERVEDNTQMDFVMNPSATSGSVTDDVNPTINMDVEMMDAPGEEDIRSDPIGEMDSPLLSKATIVKKGAKKMAAKKATGEPKKTKKQKALEEKLAKAEAKPPKKKKEKPPKAEPKPKAPVDVEKQCGVLLPNGLLCARSLTCKSHSMGAKRGVLGRSQPYDVLLAAYQRKNQAKQQKAAINASGPHPEEADGPTGPVDTDEETEQVIAGVMRSHPLPFVEVPLISIKKKYQYHRMRNMFQNALRPAAGLQGMAQQGGMFSNGDVNTVMGAPMGGSMSVGMGAPMNGGSMYTPMDVDGDALMVTTPIGGMGSPMAVTGSSNGVMLQRGRVAV